MRRLIVLGAVIMMGAAPVPKSFNTKVAEAKASLNDMSDHVAIRFWTAKRDVMDRFGITMDYNRRFARWLAAAHSIGVCEDYAKPGLIADWMGKLDGLSSVLGEGFIETRRSIEVAGGELRAQGVETRADMEMTEAQLSRYCAVELEATRQFVSSI